MTKYQRPESSYAGNISLNNRDKYQQDSSSQPKVSISSAKIDGDFNYILDALNEIDSASGSRASIDERLSVSLNADGTLKNTDVSVSLDEWVEDTLTPSLTRLDNSTVTFSVDATTIYVTNRRVKLEFTGGVILYATVNSCTYNGSISTLELIDIQDDTGAISTIVTDPLKLSYSSLKTGASGSLPLRFEDLHTQGLALFDDGTTISKFALRAESGQFEILENTGTATAPTWQVRAVVDSNGFVISDDSLPFSKLETASIATQLEAEAGVATDKLMTPERTLQLVQANGQSISGKNPISFNSSTGEISIASATYAWSGATSAVSVSNARLGAEGAGTDSGYMSRQSLPYHPLTPKAWVTFTGTGTVTLQDAWHVSSVTDLGNGQYRINFDMSMENTDYAVFVGGRRGILPTSSAGLFSAESTDVSYCEVSTWTTSGLSDWEKIDVMIMGRR